MDTVILELNTHADAFFSWWLPMQIQTGIFVVISRGSAMLLQLWTQIRLCFPLQCES